jgi:hypothetical protein
MAAGAADVNNFLKIELSDNAEGTGGRSWYDDARLPVIRCKRCKL